MRALFKLKGLLHGTGMRPNTCLKLFDQLIKPICLYGSEIWGVEFCRSADPEKIYTYFEKLPCEKLNMSMCRFILGLHKKSQISATRGELGRYPLGIDAIANVMSYCDYLQMKDKDSLLSSALSSLSQLDGLPVNPKSWVHKCSLAREYIESGTTTESKNRKAMKRIMESQYNSHWLKRIRQESKMRTYANVKYTFRREDYLEIRNEVHRKALTRL